MSARFFELGRTGSPSNRDIDTEWVCARLCTPEMSRFDFGDAGLSIMLRLQAQNRGAMLRSLQTLDQRTSGSGSIRPSPPTFAAVHTNPLFYRPSYVSCAHSTCPVLNLLGPDVDSVGSDSDSESDRDSPRGRIEFSEDPAGSRRRSRCPGVREITIQRVDVREGSTHTAYDPDPATIYTTNCRNGNAATRTLTRTHSGAIPH